MLVADITSAFLPSMDLVLRQALARPSKSVCDGQRIVPEEEAEQLLRSGIVNGMFSDPLQKFPTYVWSVDEHGEPYEANTHPNNRGQYHGYRLEEHDPMRQLVLKTWKQRCPQT